MANSLSKKYPILIRYVKPTHACDNVIPEEVFQLRDDRDPPEEYISLFHSVLSDDKSKILEVKEILNKKGFKCRPTSGFLLLNAIDATSDINLTQMIIEFKKYGYPHYGMHYLTDDLMDILEAKTILISCSKLLKLKNISQSLIQ